MRIQELDDLFREICYPGENFVFAIQIAAVPSTILMVRSMGKTGKGIIEKTEDFLRSKPNLRAYCGARSSIAEGKVAIIFLGVIGSGTLSAFRKAWYRHVSFQAEVSFGRRYSVSQMLQMIDDKTIQFQLSFDFDTCEVLDNKTFSKFDQLVESAQRLRKAIDIASLKNKPTRR